MYTKELDPASQLQEENGDTADMFMIYDDCGDYICDVYGEQAADALLSHLNRGR